MHEDFNEMLFIMDKVFRDFESGMPTHPEQKSLSFGLVYRFEEKNIYEAIIQKLARAQSLVRAAYLLLVNGFVQEQAILHRALDETNEDIMFLVLAVANGSITELHKKFLEAFWEEEVDESGNILNSEQKRPMIPRKKIRAFIASVEGVDLDPNTVIEVARSLSKAYSGFVHGASPQIMDMYGGNPSHFHTRGMLGTPRFDEHADDLWNYMYRTFISHIAVGKVIGAKSHVDFLLEKKLHFEKNRERYTA